jgi:hypothetical protein
VTETVEVSAAALTLNTENSTVGGEIENKPIIDLPLNGRNATQLAVPVPGVQFARSAWHRLRRIIRFTCGSLAASTLDDDKRQSRSRAETPPDES